MTQIAGEVLLCRPSDSTAVQTVKLSLRRRALQKNDPELWRKRIAHRQLGQAESARATGEVVYRFVHIRSKFLKKAKAPGQPRGLCGCLWCLMSLQQVNACIRIGF